MKNSVRYAARLRDIVLIDNFPYEDGSGKKTRPALVVGIDRGLVIVRGLYSRPRAGRALIPRQVTGLDRDSYLGPAVTVPTYKVIRRIAILDWRLLSGAA